MDIVASSTFLQLIAFRLSLTFTTFFLDSSSDYSVRNLRIAGGAIEAFPARGRVRVARVFLQTSPGHAHGHRADAAVVLANLPLV